MILQHIFAASKRDATFGSPREKGHIVLLFPVYVAANRLRPNHMQHLLYAEQHYDNVSFFHSSHFLQLINHGSATAVLPEMEQLLVQFGDDILQSVQIGAAGRRDALLRR